MLKKMIRKLLKTIVSSVFHQQDFNEIDTDKMTQVVDNIMNNAIKYSPDGGVITCRLLETNKHIIISISDEGLGIPRKDIKKVLNVSIVLIKYVLENKVVLDLAYLFPRKLLSNIKVESG